MDRSPVIDFDHFTPGYADNWEALARELHALDYPMAWSPHHGGFWVLGRWEDTKRVLEDYENFSSDNDVKNEREGYRGVAIPQMQYRLFLSESDPPLSSERRRIEMPFFLPKALRDWGPLAQTYLNQALEKVIEQGHADLVHDVVIPTTARTTLHILGFDPDNWQDAALSAHKASFMMPDNPEYPHAEMARLRTMFMDMMRERRANPRGDLISALGKGKVQGELLNDEEIESMMSALVFGGFDTTTSAALHALIYLDKHRDVHERLLSDAAFLNNAIDELLRTHPPTPGVARNATRDLELGGRKIAKGDRVYAWLAGANRDPSKFDDPDVIRLDRSNAADHLSFSAGGHRCLGSSLATLELREIIQTFLTRLPDYRIDHDGLERYPLYGAIYGFNRVPVSFAEVKAA